MSRIIDAWAQHPNADFMKQPWLSTLLRWTGQPPEPPSLDTTLAVMDAAGVESALLCA